MSDACFSTRRLSVVFTLYGLSVCWASYLPVWQRRELGLPVAAVGAIQAGISVAGMLGIPFFCATLDALGGRSGEAFAAFVFVINGAIHAVYLTVPDLTSATTTAVSLAIGLIVVGEMLRSACGAMLDVSCLKKLGPEHRLEYGRVRLWISLMWGVGGATIGALHPSPLSLIFLLSPFFSALLVCVYAATLRSPPPPTHGTRTSSVGAIAPPKFGADEPPKPPRAPVVALSYGERVRLFLHTSDWRVLELVLLFFLLGAARRSFETFVHFICIYTCICIYLYLFIILFIHLAAYLPTTTYLPG